MFPKAIVRVAERRCNTTYGLRIAAAGRLADNFAKRLYTLVGSNNRVIRIFAAEEGGSEPCRNSKRVPGVNGVADRLPDNL